MDSNKKRFYLILLFILLLVIILGIVFIVPLFVSVSDEATRETPMPVTNPGWLAVDEADVRGNEIVDASSGEQVGLISPAQSTVELPPGVYHVSFGGTVWKNVQIREGETTVLKPGILSVNQASYRGHVVLDAETGKECGLISNLAGSLSLVPGKYRVTFGGISWDVDVLEGRKHTLNPGVVEVEGASYKGHPIHTKDGREVGAVSNTGSSMPLPPGDYTISVGGETISFSIQEGQRLIFTEK